MNSRSSSIPSASRLDPDLVRQAQPGYGVPSQDPRPGAQQTLLPDEALREARSVYVGGGAIAGAAAGATVGAVVAGPVGAFVGGAIGGIAGVVGSVGAGRHAIHPSDVPRVTEPELSSRRTWASDPGSRWRGRA